MSHPPQGNQPPQGPGDAGQAGTPPQGSSPQAGRPGQPAYPPQGYPQQGYPQQQYPPQGYPQQPYGGSPVGTQGGPPGAYGYVPGPGGPQQPTKKKRTGLLVLIGAGALVLVLALVAVAVGVGGSTGAGSSTPGTSPSPARAAKPSDAVQGFLEAVAANDAERALGFTDEVPTDKTFLTDGVLRASSALAPMTAISVPEVDDPDAYRVSATFDLGDRSYSRDFTVTRSADGWKVSEAVSDLDVSAYRQAALPMMVNGVLVADDTVSVLPGTYVFTTGSRWVTWGAKNKVTVSEQYLSAGLGIEPTLTKAASKEVVAKTKAAFNACLDQHKLKPKGCPNHIDDDSGIKVKESSVRWRVTKDPFRNAKIDLDVDDPTIAEGTFYPDYRIKISGTKGGRRVSGETSVTGISSFTTTADLSKDTIKVKLN